ncbi:MAG: FumA C-terminus/TtdB family hydratase beta subunit [Candidatus Cloacimonetes bacterium]|nr:FumA C-terminus/TtdB family hydratase beta subunit [Candidatus Cloacimonadota bacterium]
MKIHQYTLPLSPEQISELEIGDKVLLSGVIYTARDQAHKRMLSLLNEGKELGFDLSVTAIFYCGPSPKAEGQVCGAIGPTTSSRMDKLTLPLLEAGLKVMIGKGERSSEVNEAIHEHGAVYLTAIGGVSAVLSRCIVSCETFLWPELGAEAIYRLSVRELPCYVAIV